MENKWLILTIDDKAPDVKRQAGYPPGSDKVVKNCRALFFPADWQEYLRAEGIYYQITALPSAVRACNVNRMV